VNAEIGRLEGEIRMIADRRAHLSAQIAATAQRQEQRNQEQRRLSQRSAELNASIEQCGSQHAQAGAASELQDAGLPALEAAYHAARER